MIEAPCCDVDLLGARVPLVAQGSAATVAKRPPGSRVGPIPVRSALLEPKVHSLHRDPGDGLRADRSPAIGAVAIRLVDRRLCGLETYRAAIATAGN